MEPCRKRSAVRSRLSPPQKAPFWKQNGFFCFIIESQLRRDCAVYRILIVEDDPVIAGADAPPSGGLGVHRALRGTVRPGAGRTSRPLTPIWCCWTSHCPFSTATTGARKFGRSPRCRLCFITSAIGQRSQCCMAMQMGGDDLIAKPFDLQVLSAKVQAMLRRTYDFGAAGASALTCGGAVLNVSDGTLSVPWTAGGTDEKRVRKFCQL